MRKRMSIGVCLFALCLGVGLVSAGAQAQSQPAATPSAQAKPATAPAAAATSTAPLPTVDQIVEKYQQASGGKEAWNKLTSRVEKGTFEMDQMAADGTQEIYAKAPDKELFVTDIPSFGVVQRGFNGTAGWSDNPQTGLVDVTGDELGAMRREADFYEALDLKTLYPKMTVKGKDSVNGKDAYLVECVPAEGAPVTMAFDADSGLLVRAQTVADGPMGKTDIITTLSDYRTVDGVQVPFQIHSDLGQIAFTIKLNDVKHNVDIDDKKFDKPVAAAPAATE
jgi:outer membrane lipoprotein-sorting protein